MALALWTRNMKGESISYPDSSAVAGEMLADRDCSARVCPPIVASVTLGNVHTKPTTLRINELSLSV